MVIDHSGLRAPRAWELLQKAGLPIETLKMQLQQVQMQEKQMTSASQAVAA